MLYVHNSKNLNVYLPLNLFGPLLPPLCCPAPRLLPLPPLPPKPKIENIF